MANEVALKLGLLKFRETTGDGLKHLDVASLRDEDLSNESVFMGNDVSALGFQNGVHGHSAATLSVSDISPYKIASQTYDWPIAPFPKMKYPMHRYEKHNREEEDRCLEATEKLIKEWRDKNKPVGAMIIEPISNQNNQMATPYFYKQLRKIADKEGISFIANETSTGVGATGKMWAHEHWNLSQSPDFVTFGGRSQVSGVYANPDFRTPDAHKLKQIDAGSVIQMKKYELIWKTIQKQGLLDKVTECGGFIKVELDRVRKERKAIDNVRGLGTFIAWDVEDHEAVQRQVKMLAKSGVRVTALGETTVGIRPSLILEPIHAAHLRDALQYFE